MSDLPEDPIARFDAFRRDPWLFLTHCVFTRDQVDENNPVKRFPHEWDYLRLFTYVWQKEKKLAIPKSRRMTMSWTCIALTLWDVIFHKGRDWAFVSKKEDDSMDLVSRAEFIYDHIPPDMIPKALLPKKVGGKMKKSPPVLEFGFGDLTSKIQGFPMGADQLRQFTFSGIFGDECAFWEVAEDFYTSAKPTTDGGGRMVLVSSRAPGFFKKLVFDKINSTTLTFPEVAPVPPKHPMKGVEIWKNPDNGFCIMDIHYTANENKRDESFREALKKSLPLYKYQMEYEKSWQAFAGLPVYPNFRDDVHSSPSKLDPVLGLPLLLGWDFGLTPACIVAQVVGNSLRVIKEYVSQNEGINTFSPKVMTDLRLHYPEWSDPRKDFYHYIDPAGFQRVQTDARTCAKEMEDAAGIKNVRPGPVHFEARREAVEHFLLYIDKEGAGMQIHAQDCPITYEGFKGGYRYPDKMADIESAKPRPLKDHYSHPHDAFQYLAWGARQLSSKSSIVIPKPTYGFAPDLQHEGSNNGIKKRIFG